MIEVIIEVFKNQVPLPISQTDYSHQEFIETIQDFNSLLVYYKGYSNYFCGITRFKRGDVTHTSFRKNE